MTSNSRVCLRATFNVFTLPRCSSYLLLHPLMLLPVVLSILRLSCCLAPQFLMPLMPSGFARHLFPNVRPFWVHVTALLPCPWQQCPLCHAGMAQRVIPLQAAANFFQNPPLPWVCFFSQPWCLTAKYRSPCCCFSALTVFSAASSLGTSSYTALDSVYSAFDSKSVASFSPR
jgi:hypothetical protein